jgi:hypothetical protein
LLAAHSTTILPHPVQNHSEADGACKHLCLATLFGRSIVNVRLGRWFSPSLVYHLFGLTCRRLALFFFFLLWAVMRSLSILGRHPRIRASKHAQHGMNRLHVGQGAAVSCGMCGCQGACLLTNLHKWK